MGLFETVKDSLPVSGDDYDGRIITQIKAAVLDLTKTTEIVIDGVVSIEREWIPPVVTTEQETEGYWQITDNSTIEDELVIHAISTFCNMHIGNPPNYANLEKAYNDLKGSLRLSSHYNGGAERCGC